MIQKFNDGTENAQFDNAQQEFQIGAETEGETNAAFLGFEAEGRALFNVEVCFVFTSICLLLSITSQRRLPYGRSTTRCLRAKTTKMK